MIIKVDCIDCGHPVEVDGSYIDPDNFVPDYLCELCGEIQEQELFSDIYPAYPDVDGSLIGEPFADCTFCDVEGHKLDRNGFCEYELPF